MKTYGMCYQDLLPGDVMCRHGRPIFLVLRCDRGSNSFAWMSLQTGDAGAAYTPDFSVSGMWDLELHHNYDVILRP